MHKHATCHFSFCLLTACAMQPVNNLALAAYLFVLQAFTPPPLFPQPYRHSQTWLNYLWYNAAYHGLYDEELFYRQYVPCCTTKYIFWLGKNKFD
jgi:hypothetical protein